MPCICHIYKETSRFLQASSVLEEYPKNIQKYLTHFEGFYHLLARFLSLKENKCFYVKKNNTGTLPYGDLISLARMFDWKIFNFHITGK